MMGRSHLVLAGAAYAALATRPLETPFGTLAAPVLGGLDSDYWTVMFLSLAIAAASGLGPDIDKGGSTAARSLGLPTRMLSWGIEHSFGHRGAFHSLLATILVYVLGDLASAALGVSGLGGLLAFGWAVHLLTDAWTMHGIPLFWPLPIKRVRLPPWMVTGSLLEGITLIVTLVLLAAYALWPVLLAYGLTAST